MKKKLLMLASVIICAAIITSGTLAYYTAEEKVHNVITTDGVAIDIEEWQETEEGLIPYPKDEPIKVMPSESVSKIVTIKNNEAESYIRAKYEIVVYDADDNVMDLTAKEISSVISVDINETDWLRKDGDSEWWYYGTSVANDGVTKPLFTEVTFDGPNMTNEYQECTVNVIVTAEAVQSANNKNSVLEAAGWPAAVE